MFTLERGISSKNRSIGSETVYNPKVFTSRGFTVAIKLKKNEKDGTFSV
jgi:hypothetical protein